MFLLILMWVGITLIPVIILGILIWTSINEGYASGIKLVFIGICVVGIIGGVIGTIANAVDFNKRVYLDSINSYLDVLRTDDPPVTNGSIVNWAKKKDTRKTTISLFGIEEQKYTGEEDFVVTYTQSSEGSQQYIKYIATIKNNEVGKKNIIDILTVTELEHSAYYSDAQAKSVAEEECSAHLNLIFDDLLVMGHKYYYTNSKPQFWDGYFNIRKFNLFPNYTTKSYDWA